MIQSMIISLPMMVCIILSALLGLSLHDRWDKPKSRLLIYMVVAAFLYLAHSIYFHRLTEAIPFSDTVYSFCNPAVFPLFYIYIEELTTNQPLRWRQWLYLSPAFVCFILVGLLYILMDKEETVQFIQSHLYGDNYATLTGLAWWQGQAHLLVKIVFALEIPPIFIFGWQRVTQYNRLIENFYSDIEEKSLNSVKPLLILLVTASLIAFICNAVGRYRFADSMWMLAIPSVIFSILILFIGHVGLRQKFSIQDALLEIDDTDESTGGILKDEESLRGKIRHLVEDNALYLQPNLKTNDLAKQLHTNRNYIYQVINVEMGMSFSEYINRRRIDHAVLLIEGDPNAYLADVAAKSGFSSISTFYRNFKLYIGCSPSDFQQKIQARQQSQKKTTGRSL